MTIYDETVRARELERLAQESNPANVDRFLDKAKRLVKDEQIKSSGFDTEVYIVWFSKTLQNWKALVATTDDDQLYYEVTYDGDKKTAYVDTYKKESNRAIPDLDAANPFQA